MYFEHLVGVVCAIDGLKLVEGGEPRRNKRSNYAGGVAVLDEIPGILVWRMNPEVYSPPPTEKPVRISNTSLRSSSQVMMSSTSP